MPDQQSLFQAIPSTDRCLDALERAKAAPNSFSEAEALVILKTAPHSLVRTAITKFWDIQRDGIRSGKITSTDSLSLEARFTDMVHFSAQIAGPRLAKVLNGTGVVIHTNTGRSLLCAEARKALDMASCANTTLEFDRKTGGRGSRNELVSAYLQTLTGAEDGLVVNNNAAAVLLTLDTFCKGGEAIISRGELVEIGGSFRIPDVMQASGVSLCEVGSTNRTHTADYLNAISGNTRAIVRVHTSNYRIIGFHSEVPTEELANIAHSRGLLLINDLGSGSLVSFTGTGLPQEPTVQDAIRQRSDLVLFSGDKLLGGPQAGIIVGKRQLLARLRKNPLLRALRVDKLTYAALEATLRLYLDPANAKKAIPTLRMLSTPPRKLASAALSLKRRLNKSLGESCHISLIRDTSRAGGGAFPECNLPTTLVALVPASITPEELKNRLLETSPIIIGRLEHGAFCLDPRTLLPEDLDSLTKILHAVCSNA